MDNNLHPNQRADRETSPYLPNQPYNQDRTYLSPPPVLLEPAIIDNSTGTLRLNLRPFNQDVSTYGNPRFIHNIASLPLPPASYVGRKSDWDYNFRHKAQLILPFLFLGPANAARDENFIKSNDITMAIAVRSAQSAMKLPKLLDPSRFPSCASIETTTFDVDTPYDVITRIRPVVKALIDHMETENQSNVLGNISDIKGRILVFCESGNDRSPVLVAGLLMTIYGMPWQQALNFIHSHRFSVCLNTGMNEMLQTLEGMLRAEAETVVALPTLGHNGDLQAPTALHVRQRASKRGLDDVYASDEDMTDVPEVDFRAGVAPFKDNHSSST